MRYLGYQIWASVTLSFLIPIFFHGRRVFEIPAEVDALLVQNILYCIVFVC